MAAFLLSRQDQGLCQPAHVSAGEAISRGMRGAGEQRGLICTLRRLDRNQRKPWLLISSGWERGRKLGQPQPLGSTFPPWGMRCLSRKRALRPKLCREVPLATPRVPGASSEIPLVEHSHPPGVALELWHVRMSGTRGKNKGI